MQPRKLRTAVGVASITIVLMAAVFAHSPRWDFDFAQYKGPARPEFKEEFRFVMVGDRNGGRVPELMPQAFREINHLYPDFVISVGDLIDGPTNVVGRTAQFWKEFDDEVSLLQSPFVYVPGNHDIWNPSSKEIYEQRYGPTYRSFNYRGLHFITLDTEEMDEQGRKVDRIDGGQLDWLREDLEKNRNAKCILVFLHKPIWLTGGLAKAEQLWKGMPVHVFAGHDHRYSYQVIDGIPHVILGAVAGGMGEQGDPIGRFRHYVMATVRDGDLKLALIRLGGVLPPDTVLEDELPGIRQLADACAIYPNRGTDNGVRVVFRNPLSSTVNLDLQRTPGIAGKRTIQTLLRPADTSLAAGEHLLRSLELKTLGSDASVVAEYKAIYRFTNKEGHPQAIDFPVPPRSRRTIATAKVDAPRKIDGDLGEWRDANWQEIADSGQLTFGPTTWKGKEDLSAEFSVAADSERLYLAVRVTDETVAYHATIADSDGIELFLALPTDPSEISFNRDTDWHRLMITPFSPDPLTPGEETGPCRVQQYGASRLGTVTASYVRAPTSYTIELALSRQELGWLAKDSVKPQIDLAVNDRDVTVKRKSQITWSGTDRNTFGSRYYGQVEWASR